MAAAWLVAIDDLKHSECDAKNHLGDPAEHKKMTENVDKFWTWAGKVNLLPRAGNMPIIR